MTELARAFAAQVVGGIPFVNKLVDTTILGIAGQKDDVRFAANLLPVSATGLTDLMMGVGYRKPKQAAKGAVTLLGLPVIQPVRTIKGIGRFIETGDPRYLIWSKYALGDRSTKKKKRTLAIMPDPFMPAVTDLPPLPSLPNY